MQSSCVADGSGAVHCPTSFPNPVSYGMTWNKTAFFVLGDIIGTEQRALWLAGATEFSSWSGRPHMGLDCWCAAAAPTPHLCPCPCLLRSSVPAPCPVPLF